MKDNNIKISEDKNEVTLQDVIDLIGEVKESLEESLKETRESLEKKIDHSVEEMARTTQEQFLAERKHTDEGFKQVDKRFEQIDKRFEQVDKRFDQIENQLGDIKADINKKVDKIEYNTLTYQVEKLEKKFA